MEIILSIIFSSTTDKIIKMKKWVKWVKELKIEYNLYILNKIINSINQEYILSKFKLILIAI